MTTRRVAWRRSDEVQADEHCTISLRDSGLSLIGTVLGAEDGVPVRVEYRVLADAAGATTGVHVRDLRGFAQRTLTLARDSKGTWTVDGSAAKGLKGCIDVDLGCSPSTNTLPIRRLRLAVGATKTIQAAWIRFPELTIVKAAQTYTRLDELTYHYASGTYESDLTVDGKAVRALKGCTDVDLGCSPSTNTLPIRRLRLGLGASQTIQAAWVRVPTLAVEKTRQTYTRLDEFTYRYASGTFEAELVVDEDGVVAQYAEWRTRRDGAAGAPAAV